VGVAHGAYRRQHARPVAGGTRPAACRQAADTAQAHANAVDESAWMTQMLELASRAAEEHRRSEALQILDVVHDQDPDHDLTADIKARIDAGGALDSTGRTSTSTA